VGVGVALGGALGPLLGGLFTQKVTVLYPLILSDVVVAMGILGYRSSELFFSGSDIFPVTVETRRRLLQIEIEKSRLRRCIR
jgi:hypothetical protein